MERFKGVPTLSGKVSFSKTLHTVFGRAYRIMQVTTADDFGAGSLRGTMDRINAECTAIACKVTFAGPMTTAN